MLLRSSTVLKMFTEDVAACCGLQGTEALRMGRIQKVPESQ